MSAGASGCAPAAGANRATSWRAPSTRSTCRTAKLTTHTTPTSHAAGSAAARPRRQRVAASATERGSSAGEDMGSQWDYCTSRATWTAWAARHASARHGARDSCAIRHRRSLRAPGRAPKDGRMLPNVGVGTSPTEKRSRQRRRSHRGHVRYAPGVPRHRRFFGLAFEDHRVGEARQCGAQRSGPPRTTRAAESPSRRRRAPCPCCGPDSPTCWSPEC